MVVAMVGKIGHGDRIHYQVNTRSRKVRRSNPTTSSSQLPSLLWKADNGQRKPFNVGYVRASRTVKGG
jgi:hypothetical protein